MVFLAAVVFGGLSYTRLPVTLMPELSYPTVTVRTEYAGAAPEEVENDISRAVEEALGVIAGLKRIHSVSRAGISDVILEFAWNSDMSEATQSVLEKLDQVFLPVEAKRPLILHYDPSLDPVMEISLSGEGKRFEGEEGLRRLRRLAELRIKKELEPIRGVAAVRVRGGLEEEIHVLLEEEALRRTGLSTQTIISRLAQENINVAGGTLKEGRTEYLVRTLNEFENLDQISETIIVNLNGRDIRVKDLGRVVRSHKEREIMTRTDGNESVQIEVFKEGDANIVALAKRVKAALGEYDPDAPVIQVEEEDDEDEEDSSAYSGVIPPEGLIEKFHKEEGALLQLMADRSLFIESSIKEVMWTAIIGGVLAILVLFLFLRRISSTLVVAVSIPIALLITFAPMNLLGVSLNIMSLGGLALGIGMLVDSSIVVLESIFRCREEGDGVVDAANRGGSEVRGAVLASTLTSIAVFFPMVFVEGIAGQAFGDLGLSVVVSLLASAAIALFFIPMLASREWKVEGKKGKTGFTSMLRLESYYGFRSGLRSYPGMLFGIRLSGGMVIFKPLVWLFQLIGLVLVPIYFVARLIVGTCLEIVGKSLLAVIMGITLLIRRVIAPILGALLGGLLWLPARLSDFFLRGVSRAYEPVLRAALLQPGIVVLLVIGCFWGIWEVSRSLPSELLPDVHQGEFTVEVDLPVGTPLEETDAIVRPIEKAILGEKEHIRSILLTVGYDSATSQRSDEGEHTARFKILLAEGQTGVEIEEKVIARLRKKFSGIPDLETRIVRPVLFSSRTPVEVEVHGDDLLELKRIADRVQSRMSGIGSLADVETSLQTGAPEVQIIYDRDRLSLYGLNIQAVAQLIRDKVKGMEATRFNLKDRRIPILVRLELSDSETVDDVRGLIVNPGGDRPIPLSSVASVSLGEGPSEVRRVDSSRVALVTANLAEGSLSSAVLSIKEELSRSIAWPAGMTFMISGQNEEWERSQASLWIALGLSVFLVYVIMAAQFESLLHPLVIMVTIPLAFVGTFVTLKVLEISLSIVVFLGMIMLAGIVVNNAIVLVDYINTLRRRGMPRDEAIRRAGAVRLRPILMTTATTVLGLLPMALGLGDGAEIRTPMAIAVISGLISSTVLTLIVIPSFYSFMDRIQQRILGTEPVEDRSDLSGEEASISPTGSQMATP